MTGLLQYPDYPFTPKTFDRGDGIRLNYLDEGDADAEPVLMIHGLWGDASAFQTMESDLASANFETALLKRVDYSATNDERFLTNVSRVQTGIEGLIQEAVLNHFTAFRLQQIADIGSGQLIG